jgi:excinuclease ABC subunit B
LREGLDLPEVSLVAILDADKEGFLRSERSLIQTIGRAARNVDGLVIMYADLITNSMETAISETNRRRKLQLKYNELHGITPVTVKKAVRDLIQATTMVAEKEEEYIPSKNVQELSQKELEKWIKQVEKEMQMAARKLAYEKAAELRDLLFELKKQAAG